MTNIMITGISGNVGSSVAKHFEENKMEYIVGVRNPKKIKANNFSQIRYLDFENPESYNDALRGIDTIFLVRPPQLTDIVGIFLPFIKACKSEGVCHIVFLSLLGVEKNPFPPHHKIEKLIESSGIDYTFIRPSFFMQNLINPHAEDIRLRNEIYIPSGKAKISFIDTEDIGEIIAITMLDNKHRNKKYTVTGPESITYYDVAKQMSHILEREISYTNPSLLKFRKEIIRRGTKKEFANVMTILYLTTKFGLANHLTDTVEEILGRKPNTIKTFTLNNKEIWK
ncbi:MAG: SDR family oxidoreductase [Acidaminobacteraceae bacterium]